MLYHIILVMDQLRILIHFVLNLLEKFLELGAKRRRHPYADHRRRDLLCGYACSGEEMIKMINQKDFFKNYTQKLRSIRSKAKSQLADLADNFFDTLESNGFSVDDFSRKSSGPCGYFIKLKSGDFITGAEFVEKLTGVPVRNLC